MIHRMCEAMTCDTFLCIKLCALRMVRFGEPPESHIFNSVPINWVFHGPKTGSNPVGDVTHFRGGSWRLQVSRRARSCRIRRQDWSDC